MPNDMHDMVIQAVAVQLPFGPDFHWCFDVVIIKPVLLELEFVPCQAPGVQAPGGPRNQS